MDSILLLTNVEAGSADDEKLGVAIAELRTTATVEVCITSGQGELDDVLNHLGRRQLVVAGGDGSFHGVVAALNRRNELRQTVLGLIPVGTGNDFARAVGIPLDPEAAARVHRRGNTVSISGTAFYPSSDGEISGPVSNRTWRVMKSAFRMTLP